jgi:hypothetical protein
LDTGGDRRGVVVLSLGYMISMVKYAEKYLDGWIQVVIGEEW